MKKTKQHPLEALGDILATPREIEDFLEGIAFQVRESFLEDRKKTTITRVRIRESLEHFLAGRHFAGFKKKRTLDRVIKKALANYKHDVKRRLRVDLSMARRDGDKYTSERIVAALRSGDPGYDHRDTWSYNRRYR